MAKLTYDVIECSGGAQALKECLNEIQTAGLKVVSIVPDHGGSMFSAIGSGTSLGFLIVVEPVK